MVAAVNQLGGRTGTGAGYRNVQAAMAQLRGLVGTVPVFAEGRKLYGRIGFDRAQLVRLTNLALLKSGL
jgi:hypothetical protein